MGESSSSSFSTRSFASCPSNGLGPRGRRSSKAARPSPAKRDTTAYTVVREQKSTRAISVGERPSEESSAMCNLSLRRVFALYLDDEVCAYLRCDFDILHVRPCFLGWDSGGVLTCLQTSPACLGM